jgi:glycosyltransferase involved in cell wall biosynthesis
VNGPRSGNPKRVLFYTLALGGGGAESHALRVMNHLDRGRYLPSLAVTRRGGTYEQFLRDDVRVHAVGPAAVRSSSARAVLSTAGLRSLLAREPFDVVCSLLELPNLAALVATRGVRPQPKLVFCVQNPPTIEQSRSRFGQHVFLPALRAALPRGDRVVALSQGVRADLEVLAPRLRGHVDLVHNACVDDDVRSAAELPIDEPLPSGPLLLGCGRLTYQKGWPYLIEALAKIRTKHPAELWILGEGSDRAALERQIGALGLGSAVRLLGFRDRPQRYMSRATVFVLSSLYEGFGNVVAEAMASGAPVVSTDCPFGPGEILEHERSGLLVPMRDPDAFSAAVVRLLDDPALRERLSTAGRERAERFDATRIADEYADVFDRALGLRTR